MKNGLFSNPSRRAFLATCSSAALMGSSLPGGAFRQARLTFPFKKTDQVLLPRGPAGSFDSTHAKYPCVLKVRDEWWMWYNGRSDDSFTGAVGLATSSDGLQWTKSNDGKPVLDHGGPGAADETKVDHPAVLFFDDQFHMWYTAGPRNSAYQVCYATSQDGRQWQRQNRGQPVLGPGVVGKFDDKVVLHPAVVRDESGRLHLWYNGVGPQSDFHVGHATSRDGITWRRENGGDPVLSAAPSPSRPEVYVYNVNVLLEAGVYRMWYSSAQKLLDTGRYAPGGSAIVYAESENGTHWERDPVNTLVSGKSGSDDAYACFAPHVVRRDRELWMYYSMGSVYQRYQVGLARGPASSPAE
jgi:predicted GH43/DUF377 family glycosyl hydrolase